MPRLGLLLLVMWNTKLWLASLKPLIVFYCICRKYWKIETHQKTIIIWFHSAPPKSNHLVCSACVYLHQTVLFPSVVIRSCWLCQESEIWKSAVLVSRCLLVLNQLCRGSRGVKSDRNVNTGENGSGWTFKEKHSRHSSPPWQTKQFASVTPAVAKWLEWKFMGKGMVLLL